MLNEHFSQEHADAQHNGEESENNLRIEWEDELALNTPLKEVLVHRKATYTIQGQDANGVTFSYDIPETVVFDIVDIGGTITQMACSESVMDHFEIIEEEGGKCLNVFMQESEPHTNPIPGIYIALQEFPKELI
jgi:hypothetical protein